MDENTRRALKEIRADLETIRAKAGSAMVKLARLGAGFGSVVDTTPRPRDHVSARYWAIRDLLPEDLLSKLTIVDQGDGVYTVTSEWLGKPDWARVDGKVKSVGGTWIRDGKASRWEIPTP